jgi:hypothetical protein
MKERIQLTDSTLDILIKMSDGNPGALTVLMRMLKEGGAIDPQSFAGGLGAILSMDSHGIHGSRVWMLYKDVCKESSESTLAVLRACQLGQLSESTMLTAIDTYGQGVDVAAIVASVKERLPQFGAKEADAMIAARGAE